MKRIKKQIYAHKKQKPTPIRNPQIKPSVFTCRFWNVGD